MAIFIPHQFLNDLFKAILVDFHCASPDQHIILINFSVLSQNKSSLNLQQPSFFHFQETGFSFKLSEDQVSFRLSGDQVFI
jgi:hypothetical protein